MLAVMEIMIKNVFVWLTIPLFSTIPAPTSLCSSGVLENNLDGIYETLSSKRLTILWSFGVITFVMLQFISLVIIKELNAMTKVMNALLKTFVIWIFFMIYPGMGHEAWSWPKALGMLCLSIGIIYYVKLDI